MNMINHNSISACDEITRRRKAMKWDIVRSLVYKVIVSYNRRKGSLISDEDVEDAVQNACLKIFENIGDYDKSKSKLITWMSKIATNCYYDALRKTNSWNNLFCPYTHEKRVEDDEVLDSLNDSPGYCTNNETSSKELEGLFALILKPLCENYRTAIRCLYDGAQNEELAEQLHCSENNIRPTISRARKAARTSCMSLGII